MKEIGDKSQGNVYLFSDSQYYTPSKMYQIGDMVLLGSTEQDGENSAKELIEWQIISASDDAYLLISKYGLVYKPFQEDNSGSTWEKSSLRSWLNNEFVNDCFSQEEQQYIYVSQIRNDNNPSYYTDGGSVTQDRVFCISVDESIKYFDGPEDRIARPTEYAISTFKGQEAHRDGDYWWLRTPGHTNTEVMNVRGYGSDSGEAGSVNYFGSHVYGNGVMVRPAMWIKAEMPETKN